MSRNSVDDSPFDPSLANFRTWLVPTSSVIDLLTVSHAQERVEEFRRAMSRGDCFPPISGIRLGKRIILADGHKRLSAYRALGGSHLPVEIWPLRKWFSDQARQARKTIRRAGRAAREIRSEGIGSHEARDLFGGMIRHHQRIGVSLFHLAARALKHARRRAWHDARNGLDTLVVALLSLVSKWVSTVPRPLAARFGSSLGALSYYVLSSHRTVALQNLEAALGDRLDSDLRKKIAKASFSNLMRTSVLLLRSPLLPGGEMAESVDYDPLFVETARSTYRQGGGLILSTMHFGDWEIGAQFLASMGIPLAIEACAGEGEVVPYRSRRIERFLWRLRGTTGNRRAESTAESVEWVSRGGVAACLVDLNGSSRMLGQWIDFMGLASYTKTSVGEIAQLTQAPILFAWCRPLEGGRARFDGVRIEYPADATPTEISRLCLQAGERIVEKYPEFWLWCYRKWRRRPSPELEGYPPYSKYRLTSPPAQTGSWAARGAILRNDRDERNR